jgi:prevent-host-death family protein
MATVVSPNAQGLKVINIHEAKTHLSRLVEEAASGHTVVIAKAGKPLAKLMPLDSPEPQKPKRRFGFLAGQIKVPDDFDTLFQDEIEKMFYGEE